LRIRESVFNGKKTEVDFLEEEIAVNINILKKKSKINKQKTRLVNSLSILLGASVTLILGFDVDSEHIQNQKNIALVLSSLLTIINSWGAFTSYKKLWIRQKNTLLELYQIQNELKYKKSKNTNPEVDDIFEKYQLIWKNNSDEWKNITKNTSDLIIKESVATQKDSVSWK